MSSRYMCSQQDCMIPHTDCLLGNESPSKCRHAKKEGSNRETQKHSEHTPFIEGQSFPWTGSSLGEKDLAFLSASRSVHLIGLVGVHNSGKTTLLTILYCLLRQGYKIGDYFLAGSYTLMGWEALAYYMTWKAGNDISFPPHTSGTLGRIPGLLHLSLKKENGERKDLILTDAKGEWFSDWAINDEVNTAATPQWIQRHSQSFILVADSEALSGPQRGLARDAIKNIFNRLNNTLGSRQMALVWTKSDIAVKEGISQNIEEHIKRYAPSSNVFKISAYKEPHASAATNGQLEVLKIINWILESESKFYGEKLKIVMVDKKDYFLSYR